MRTLIISALAATLCAAPALAQSTVAPKPMAPKPTDIAGQIKQDLDVLTSAFNKNYPKNNPLESGGPYFISGSRKGYFGYREWLSQISSVFTGTNLYVDNVRVTGNEGDNIIATVTYSFRPRDIFSPDVSNGWKKIRKEVVRFKRGPSSYHQKDEMWQIVPPDISPGELTSSSDIPQNENFWNIVAYHLAQKQSYKKSGTPAERSLMQLQDLGFAVKGIVQDYDLIYAFDPRYIFQALEPYLVNTASLSVPDANEIYTFNANLSGLTIDKVKGPKQTVLFYEGQNETPTFRYDGKAAICFADGHVVLVSPDEAKNLIWKP